MRADCQWALGATAWRESLPLECADLDNYVRRRLFDLAPAKRIP